MSAALPNRVMFVTTLHTARDPHPRFEKTSAGIVSPPYMFCRSEVVAVVIGQPGPIQTPRISLRTQE